MRNTVVRGFARLACVSITVMLLTACTSLTQEGSTMRDDPRSALHQQVEVEASAAVPEAIDVDVTTFRSGLGVNLSVTVTLESPELVSVDLVDRALRAAWSIDEGQSNSVELDVRDADDGTIALGDVVEELGVGGGVGSRVTVSRQDLADRYGE